MAFQLMEESGLKKWSETVIYNTSKGPAIGVYQNNKGVLLADSALFMDNDALTFHVKHHWWAMNIDAVKMFDLSMEVKNEMVVKRENFIQTAQRSIFLYRNKYNTMPADVWLINEFCYPPDSMRQVNSLIFTKKYLNHEAWRNWCRNLEMKVIFLEEGAVVL